jgi:hypothetical protein
MWLLTYNFYYMFGSSLNTKTAVSLIHITFGVFTAVNMKMAFFWDVTPCSFVCLWYRVGTSTGKSNWCLVTSPRTMSYLNFILHWIFCHPLFPSELLLSPPFHLNPCSKSLINITAIFSATIALCTAPVCVCLPYVLSYVTYFSAQKMEALVSSKILVPSYQTTISYPRRK